MWILKIRITNVSKITKKNFEYFPHTASSCADMTIAIDHVSMIKSSSSSSSKDETMNKSKIPSRSSKLKSSELDNLNDSNDVFDSSSGVIMTKKFQQTMITTNKSTNHETNADDRHPSNTEYNLYNLGAILSTLFPTNMTDIDPEEDFKRYVKCSSTNDQFQFMNELTIHLKNVENAKALKHQWAKSAAKKFLVKSLGIDSRNIVSKYIIKTIISSSLTAEAIYIATNYNFSYMGKNGIVQLQSLPQT